ncbi:MAG: restriction endonuclease [Candidatus Phosphoribacter sp.]|nr:restriction endonuclease [Actinomycetales bacterium]
MTPEELPAYSDLILPTVRAVTALGGSATSREVTSRVLADLAPSEEMLAVTHEHRPQSSVLVERIQWARSYAKLIRALESPKRGVFLVTPLGKELVALPPEEGFRRTMELDREYRRNRPKRAKERTAVPTSADPEEAEAQAADTAEEESLFRAEAPGREPERWQDVLLSRLHRLSPDAFEEFVLYLLRLFGLELERVGGSGDEGIDGIGTAPISKVLSSRVAVQIKRYDPIGKPVGRETVALFQRDAQTKGAERAILVTLSGFSEPARRAAIVTSPTVDLIDGERLADLVKEQRLGVRSVTQVDPAWFDRFD